MPRRTDKEKRSPAPSVKRPKRNTVFYRKKPKRRTDFSPGISKRCTDFHLNRPQHSTGFFPGSPERCTGFSPTPCGRQKDTRPGVSFLSGIFRFFACRIFFVQPFCIVLPTVSCRSFFYWLFCRVCLLALLCMPKAAFAKRLSRSRELKALNAFQPASETAFFNFVR